jgi:hypothetical protein
MEKETPFFMSVLYIITCSYLERYKKGGTKMSKELNHLGTTLYAARDKEQYDDAVKNLLADVQIIAWILRDTTVEFKNMGVDEIIPYIENPYVSQIAVMPGLTYKSIEGLPTESKIIGEGAVYYDVRFFAKIPHSENVKSFRIIVDLEGQKSPYPGYSIPARGIAYGCRMISEQFGRNVVDGDYDSLDKVYSIWLIFNCNRQIANTIVSYTVKPQFVYGKSELTERYDLIEVITINIPKEGEIEKTANKPSELHKMLYDVFVEKKSAEEKIKLIKDRYNLVSESLGRRINVMCNLSEALVEDTRKATAKIIKLLMLNKTSEEIEDLTGYPLELIEKVKADLEEDV